MITIYWVNLLTYALLAAAIIADLIYYFGPRRKD